MTTVPSIAWRSTEPRFEWRFTAQKLPDLLGAPRPPQQVQAAIDAKIAAI